MFGKKSETTVLWPSESGFQSRNLVGSMVWRGHHTGNTPPASHNQWNIGVFSEKIGPLSKGCPDIFPFQNFIAAYRQCVWQVVYYLELKVTQIGTIEIFSVSKLRLLVTLVTSKTS